MISLTTNRLRMFSAKDRVFILSSADNLRLSHHSTYAEYMAFAEALAAAGEWGGVQDSRSRTRSDLSDYCSPANLRVLESAPIGSLPVTRPSHPGIGQGSE